MVNNRGPIVVVDSGFEVDHVSVRKQSVWLIDVQLFFYSVYSKPRSAAFSSVQIHFCGVSFAANWRLHVGRVV